MPVKITLLGSLHLQGLRDNQDLPLRGRALIALLAVADRCVHRDRIADLLWDSSSATKSRHSLRQLLYVLRRCLPTGALVSSPEGIQLQRQSISCDLWLFKGAVASGDLQRALDLYKGQFIDGFGYLTDQFDDWRDQLRLRLTSEAVDICERLIDGALDAEHYDVAATIARQGLQLHPTNVVLAQRRIEALAASGLIATALIELDQLRKRIRFDGDATSDELLARLTERVSQVPVFDGAVGRNISVPLIGREREVALLVSQLRHTSDGCRASLIYGEPGIGKSRLLRHVARRAVLDGYRSFSYSCSQVDASLPYSAIVGVMRDGFRATDAPGLSERWRASLAAIAPELFNAQTASEEAPRIIFESIAQYFIAVTRENSVAICIDNFDYADEASRQAVAYLHKRLNDHSAVLVLAGRQVPAIPLFEDEHATIVSLHVGELSSAHSRALIERTSESLDQAIAPQDIDLIVGQTGGRPFLLIEVTRAVLCGGGRFDSATIEDHYARRLDLLSTQARQLLSVSAIFNRGYPIHSMTSFAELEPESCVNAADELLRHGLLADRNVIRFSHDLVREMVIRQMSSPQRVRWHLRVADVLTRTLGSRFGEIAFHYEEAGNSEDAAIFSRLAIDEAEKLSAHTDANEQYQRLLRCTRSSESGKVKLQYFQFLVNAGWYDEAHCLLPDVELLGWKTDDPVVAVLSGIVRLWAMENDERLSVDDYAERAHTVIRIAQQHAPALLGTVLLQVLDIVRSKGDYELLASFADGICLEATHLPATSAARSQLLSIGALTGSLSYGYEIALPVAQEATEIAATAPQHVLALSLYSRGTIRLFAGDVGGCREDYERLLNDFEAVLPAGVMARVRSNLSVALLEHADFIAAERFAQSVLREATPVRRPYAYGNLALVALRRGDYDGARHFAKAMIECHRNAPQEWIPPHAEALLGLCDLGLNDLVAAEGRAVRVLNQIDQGAGVIDCSHMYELGARVAALRGHLTESLALLARGAEAIASKELLPALRLSLLRASILSTVGDSVRATAIAAEVQGIAKARQARAILELADSVLAGCASSPTPAPPA
jgi:DNA-binding SARP family transcriptional activator/tetratricopeptide (TPR) repeat protein